MAFIKATPKLSGIRYDIENTYRADEKSYVQQLLDAAQLDSRTLSNIELRAKVLVEAVRKARQNASGIDSFLNQYALSTDEGIALMCLAEALLRVPDKDTVDALIKDKLSKANWQSHLGKSKSFFVNATTWALMLTGSILEPHKIGAAKMTTSLRRFMQRTSEPVIRKAVHQAMRIMSKQFVMGRTIKEAIKRARELEKLNYRYSYDMLGEAAHTEEDADRYFDSYKTAIIHIGKASIGKDIYQSPGISIKLSALHPRYEVAQYQRVINELTSRLLELAQLAKEHGIALTVDAEESERLSLSLDVIERVFTHPSLANWNGFGLAVQSYQKRAFYVLDFIAELAKKHNKRMMVRLIKGAYWDSEIKNAQMEGLSDYPVFTRKCFTDISFQACAKKLLTLTDYIYPQFATHNAYSVALILELVGDYRDFEFQCLHGMGTELYHEITPEQAMGIPCRIYAPVGSHEDLLPYLVRRLLENGANSSFVNRIVDDKAPIDSLIESPLQTAEQVLAKINKNIPLPKAIFGPSRLNPPGKDVNNYIELNELTLSMNRFATKHYQATPLIAQSYQPASTTQKVLSPNNFNDVVGEVAEADRQMVDAALQSAADFFPKWEMTPVTERAKLLLGIAEQLETHYDELLMLLMREAGKTLADAIAEIREAIDFCRYYAQQARETLAEPVILSGYTGELNSLSYHGRGPMLCISPWNFPLAIFSGQIVAALVAGNPVLAKPAEQTSLVAHFVINLFYQAGIPKEAVQLLPGKGNVVGTRLVADERIKGVLFTGSTGTAKHIQRALAKREGEIVPLIAETGGLNAMIVDSSSLLEQVVVDVISSSFGSAGQRCSALRLLYVQKDIYPRFKSLLAGAMAQMSVGSTLRYANDVGPVIDKAAWQMLDSHAKKMEKSAKIIASVDNKHGAEQGHFFNPIAFELKSAAQLKEEKFGPILHVVPFMRANLDKIIDEINASGYGLTLGIHSRVDETACYIASKVKVGNCYVNRNMTGAVVGLQPFGGQGLSGTGPKAGGPNYLKRLCHERTITIDTTAAGGNASLMAAAED